ncbi:type II secretion system protein [Bacillus sp. EB600]|nr:type II secretion system protein [Bacillus sp. EB600]
MVKKKLKNEKGFTLIELLAVIVILGIIAAIAVPSVMNIMNNSKKDAHVANAQQMVNSSKLYISQNNVKVDTTGQDIKLSDMMTAGVIDEIKDPSGKGYNTTKSLVNVKTKATNDSTAVYTVTLVSDIPTGGTETTYIPATDVKSLDKSLVTLP